MEWYTLLGTLLIIVLVVILGVLLACALAGQRCTVSIQQRQQNHELTKIQQEKERKRQKKLSSRLKRALNPSAKSDQPLAPVEDVKTVEFTLKLGDRPEPIEEVTPTIDSTKVILLKDRLTQAELDERQRKRDEIRKKYNL
ncbi:unnamed protein product [Adineta ricciae]|uniref:Uncharacterized protein n=1 Tax=Adineta ricciae TaxID=249248 RepID=A0A815XRB6_ADIRI|nr:unnamed protein product [Adineta ricciae]CAF1560756.1 unnamed protein product [Adineta ricciae]